jgi:hypothetical protein
LEEIEDVKGKKFLDNILENSRTFGIAAVGGFGLMLLCLFLRYFLLVYKFQNIKGTGGDIFQGIADFFGLGAFLGFGIMLLGLLSLAVLGKDVNLYLRIGIIVTAGFIISRFLSLGFFF